MGPIPRSAVAATSLASSSAASPTARHALLALVYAAFIAVVYVVWAAPLAAMMPHTPLWRVAMISPAPTAVRLPTTNATVILPGMDHRVKASYGLQMVAGRGMFAFRRVIDTDNNFFSITRRVVLEREPARAQDVTLDDGNVDAVRALAGAPGEPKAVYLVIDTVLDTAFDHFVKESAVWLPLWHTLLAVHPNLQLVARGRKGYKTLFYKAYGVPLERVVYGPPFPETDNLVYFPPLTSLHARYADRQGFLDLILEQADFLLRRAGLPTGCPSGAPPPTQAVFLPRGSKENYRFEATRGLEELVALVRDELQGTVLLADEQDDLSAQVRTVASAKVLIVNYGSANFFNSAFARNATIFVVGANANQQEHPEWLYHSLHYHLLGVRNVVHFMSDDYDVPQLVEAVRAAAAAPPLQRECGGVLPAEPP